MVRRAALRPETLAALGIEKLAKIILDETQHNAPFKRIVNAALAGTKGPDAVAAIIDRRLASLERARGYIEWEKHRAFASDLKALVATIADELGGADPNAAADRILRFAATAASVFDRVDDSSGSVGRVYADAAETLPAMVQRVAPSDRRQLLSRIVAFLLSDEYGVIQDAMNDLVSALSTEDLAIFDAALAKALPPAEAGDTGGDWKKRARRAGIVRVRQAIADARKDVEAFITMEAQQPVHMRDTIAVAERLLQAGRTAEALEWVRRPNSPGVRVMTRQDLADGSAAFDLRERARTELEIKILEAGNDREAAQHLRWTAFQTTFDARLLRDYLAKLPDFEDEEALDRAFAYVAGHKNLHHGLEFFVEWPRLDLAAKLVLAHIGTWNGRLYNRLMPAAEALEADHPAAATVLYRALINDILERGVSPAYGHAARYLTALEHLASEDFKRHGIDDHVAYRDALKKAHGRKYSFWDLFEDKKKPLR